MSAHADLPRSVAQVLSSPQDVPSLPLETVEEVLDRWEAQVPARTTATVRLRPGKRALVFGDTHSDWPTVQMLAGRVLGPGRDDLDLLVGTGDYVDRATPELPFGSVVNALLLLSLELSEPERVLLLRGNHETQRTIPILRAEVVDEANDVWGAGTGVGRRLERAFDRMPLAAETESGAYLAHAGFPRDRGKAGWKGALAHESVKVLEEVVWNDLEVSSFAGSRGLEIAPITEGETLEFLHEAGLGVFLRGHDPMEAGKSRYQDRVLTLHTSRVYDWAGLHVAELPLDGKVRDLRDVRHLTLEAPPIPGSARAPAPRRYPK